MSGTNKPDSAQGSAVNPSGSAGHFKKCFTVCEQHVHPESPERSLRKVIRVAVPLHTPLLISLMQIVGRKSYICTLFFKIGISCL